MKKLDPAKKKQLCEACILIDPKTGQPFKRNYFCTKKGDEIRRLIKDDQATCEGWGNKPKEKPVIVQPLPSVPLGDKIRFGICMPNCSMGGVSRGFLTMMNAPVNHGIEWAGIAIGNVGAFDPETARRILQHCPIYSTKDDPKFQGLVTIVPNACQTVVDQSDIVNLWGYIHSNPEINAVDWNAKPILIVAHGQCDWTRKNLAVSLSKGSKHILASVSGGGVKCFPVDAQERVTVIFNGVDFTRCAPARDRVDTRYDLGIPAKSKAVGYIGRFATDKNPLAVARGVAELGENYHAVYVGDGFQRDEVIAESQKLCGDRVTFVPRTEDVGTILAALDCMVLASPSEGGPQTVIESWLAGCPVVSTPVGMIPDLEDLHGPLVFGVPREPTRRELATAIKEAIAGDERIERARKLAWNLFSASRMVLNYESTIREALKPEPVPAPVPKNRIIATLQRLLKCWSTIV